jgi:TPR repeat protein
VKQDAKEAVRWYTRPAELGNGEAMFRLAEYLRDGVGVKQDRAQAFYWFSLAGSRNYAGAQEAAAKLTPQMTHEEIDTAREKLMARIAKPASAPAASSAAAIEEKQAPPKSAP